MKYRAVLSLLLALIAGGCGFHPLLSAHGGGSTQLAAVYVDILPNRAGQLLRQALQAKLEGSTSGVARRFTLTISYAEVPQPLAVQSDNSFTRIRDIGSVVWSLRAAATASQQLAGGTVRSMDGYNIVDEQFFYADLSEEATQRRLADALADQVVARLAVYFDKHPEHG